MNKYSKYFLLILILFLIIPFKFDSHFFDSEIELSYENWQGLECLKEENELYLISAEDGGSIYDANSLSKIASFQNPNKDNQKAINFMSNTNSFVRIGNTGIAVNTTSRLAPNITIYDFEKHMQLGFLSDDVVFSVHPQDQYKTLHIESIDFGKEKYILLSGIKNSTPTLEFLKLEDKNILNENGLNIKSLTSICEMPGKAKTQNIYWDHLNEELVFSKNSFFLRGSQIERIKFLNPETLIGGVCPNLKTISSTLFLTHKELEAYSKCGDSQYFLYNHSSSLYERQ